MPTCLPAVVLYTIVLFKVLYYKIKKCFFVCDFKCTIFVKSIINLASLVAQTAQNPPAMWETLVLSLGWEDLLEEEMTTHSSILAWRIPMHRGAWQATVHGVARSWTQLSN